MTKAALFAAALLIGLPTASYAQTATQGTTVETGAGDSAPTPKVKKARKAKTSKATKVRRTTTTGTSGTAGATTGTSTTTGVTTGTSGTVRSGPSGAVGR